MHISLIDDEIILTQKIQKKLKKEGYIVTVYTGYHDFISRWSPLSDLYLIDLSLSDGSGFEVIHYLRKKKKVTAPILIVSGQTDSSNIIYGLEIGADDYITKPFLPEVLIARIHAVIRRSKATQKEKKIIFYKNISFDLLKYEVSLSGEIIDLTRQEKIMLEMFFMNLNRVVSRDSLIERVWSWVSLLDVKDNSINVTLSRIKKKLWNSFQPTTLYNEGYMLEW